VDVIKLIEGKAVRLSWKGFHDEKEIQTLVEKNIGEFFDGLEFVKTELNLKGYRFDTVAYDSKQKCLVIIEYKKRDPTGSVLTQCLAYLKTVDEYDSKFAAECDFLEKFRNLSSPYVIIVTFNLSQRLVDACKGQQRIRLYHIDLYGDGIITLDYKNRKEPITVRPIITTRKISAPGYRQPGHEIHEKIKKYILDKEDMKYGEAKYYNKFFCTINGKLKIFFTTTILKKEVKLYYNIRVSDKILKSDSFVHDVSTIGKLGIGDYMSKFDSNNINQAFQYIDAVYNALRS